MNESVNKFVKNIKMAKFVMSLLNDNTEKIEPEINPSTPLGYKYPLAEEYFGKSAHDELEEMAKDNLLEKILMSSELGCPKDGSINLSLKRQCPNCDSTNIKMQEMLEHVSCGFIGPEAEFIDNKCPKCSRQLEKPDIDFKRQGRQYICENCKIFFQNPIDKAMCLKDKYIFSLDSAKKIDLFAYKITELLRNEVNKAIDQQKYLSQHIQELGFKIESPARIRGRSGVEYDFFLLATSGSGFFGVKIIVEIIAEAEVGVNDILNLYGKAMDISANGILVGAVPTMSPDAKAIADNYNIVYVEAEDLPIISDRLVRKFGELIGSPEERVANTFKPADNIRAA